MLSFPRPISDFMDRLPIKSVQLTPTEPVQISETAGGEILSEQIGTVLWQGRITLGRITPNEAAEARALIHSTMGPGRSFMMTDPERYGPRKDPTGALLGSAVPTLHTVGLERRTMRIANLPAFYALRVGDCLSFNYGSSPIRFALHEVAEPVNADAAGTTPAFEVTPSIETASTGQAVMLLQPACKAIIIPNTLTPGTKDTWMTEGMAFSAIQTLR